MSQLTKTYIYSFHWLRDELKNYLYRYAFGLSVIDISEVIQHRVDCYIYGSTFKAYSTDPLDGSLISFGLTSDVRLSVNRMIDDYIETVLSQDKTALVQGIDYMVEWIDAYTVKLEPVPAYIGRNYENNSASTGIK